MKDACEYFIKINSHHLMSHLGKDVSVSINIRNIQIPATGKYKVQTYRYLL